MTPKPTLIEIVTALRDVYEDQGCVIWLTAQQSWPHPGGGTYSASAMFIIGEGRSDEVMVRIDQLRSGAFV